MSITEEGPRITSTTVNGVLTLTLNRPQAGNALDGPMFDEWEKHLDKASTDPSVVAVIVTGAGESFSIGADVKVVLQGAIKELRKGPVTTKMIDFPKYIVAAVNGPVAGYPAGLLGLFDAVYVSERASYWAPWLQLGIAPEACSSYTLPRTVGVSKANEILMSAKRLSATELVSLGIAAKQFPAAGFLEAVQAQVAAQVAAAAPSSVLHSKRLLRPKALRDALHAVNEAETVAIKKQFEAGVPMPRFKAAVKRASATQKSASAPRSKL